MSGLRVVHDDAVPGDIHADVPAYLAIMESIQVDAFSIDPGELIARVNRAVHVARRVHAHRDGAPLHVHRFLRKTDARTAISFHAHLGRVPHLERVAPDAVEAILREHAAGIARRGVERVRPDAVAAYVAQFAPRDAEIAGAFLQQNAARRIVAARRVARPAVVHPHTIDRHLPRPAHQHGEPRDFPEAHVQDGELRNALRQHAVARREAREGHVVPRQPEARFQLSAIAVHCEIAQQHMIAAHHDQRAPVKIRRRAQHRAGCGAAHFRAILQHHLRMDFDRARRQLHEPAARQRRQQKCGGHRQKTRRKPTRQLRYLDL